MAGQDKARLTQTETPGSNGGVHLPRMAGRLT